MITIKSIGTRNLHGNNIFFNGTGALINVVTVDNQKAKFFEEMKKLLSANLPKLALGYEHIYSRDYSNGFLIALQTHVDLKDPTTDILELAYEYALNSFNNQPQTFNFLEKALKLTEKANLHERELFAEAQKHNVNCLFDGANFSLGSGTGVFVGKTKDVVIKEIPWNKIYDIPSVLVTGTNGKTTTVRLTSYISSHAGKITGYCSTDGVLIDGKLVDAGDYSGPKGNQLVLANPNVEVAILEVARGGLIKRGLAVKHVTAAAVLNVTEDHMGLDGADTLDQLSQAKYLIHNAVKSDGRSIMNLDDPQTHRELAHIKNKKAYLSRKLTEAELQKFCQSDDEYICFIESGAFYVTKDGKKNFVTNVNDVSLTFQGKALHNIENILVAICLSIELGRNYAEIGAALNSYVNDVNTNSGRFNIYTVNGGTMLLDYGHNLASIQAMIRFSKSIAKPTDKITMLVGFAGDRLVLLDDIAKCIVENKVDNIIIKRFEEYSRGAESGEAARIITSSLIKHGLKPEQIVASVEKEVEAMELALKAIDENSIYLMFCQAEIPEVTKMVQDYIKDKK